MNTRRNHSPSLSIFNGLKPTVMKGTTPGLENRRSLEELTSQVKSIVERIHRLREDVRDAIITYASNTS